MHVSPHDWLLHLASGVANEEPEPTGRVRAGDGLAFVRLLQAVPAGQISSLSSTCTRRVLDVYSTASYTYKNALAVGVHAAFSDSLVYVSLLVDYNINNRSNTNMGKGYCRCAND